MRLRTDGEYAHRKDTIETAADVLDENTNTQAVLKACEYLRRMQHNLERAVEHDDMTEELAEVLSTPEIPVEYRVETYVGSDG